MCDVQLWQFEQACLPLSLDVLSTCTQGCVCSKPCVELLMWFAGADMQQTSSSAEGTSNGIGQGHGSASPRLGRSSSVGMGSGESQSSGRGPTWSQMPRSHGSRVTARIPSWLHLPSLGQSAMCTPCSIILDLYNAAGTLSMAVGKFTQKPFLMLPSITTSVWSLGRC